MKVLCIINSSSFTAQRHVFSHIVDYGHDIAIELIAHGSTGNLRLTKFADPALHDEHRGSAYDVVLCGTHLYGGILGFIHAVAPKAAVIFYEHDLLEQLDTVTKTPRTFNGQKTHQIVYHQKQYNSYAAGFGKGLLHTFRWYMDSAPTIDTTRIEVDRAVDIVVPNIDELYLVEPPTCFRQIYQKNYWERVFPGLAHAQMQEHTPDAWMKAGTKTLPAAFDGPAGSVACCTKFRYVFCIESGSLAESILFGAIPIIHPLRTSKSRPIDDILSEITLSRKEKIGPFKAVTTDNIAYKIKKLNSDSALRMRVRQEMYQEWFDGYDHNAPTFEESLLSLIESVVK